MLLAAGAATASATVLTFNINPFPGNNSDLSPTYGSNKGVADLEFTDGGEGMTPNIALTWAPTGGPVNVNDPNADVLELHTAVTFTNVAGPAFTAPVLQLDVDFSNHNALPAHPTVDFVPSGGKAVRIHELKIGNATDQTETPHPWTISILELPSLSVVSSYTTAALSAGNSEIATFNYTGQPGVSYRMLFNDGDSTVNADHHPRTAIDNVRFSQVVPEPSALALILCGLGLVSRKKRS
jgi:hypothetical protein